MAPFRLRLFPPVVKSKHNGEGLCSHQFTIFVEAVGCRDHPGASNLIDENLGVDYKTYQGGTAHSVDVILALILVPNQSCNPGVGILL